jgi:hypothetical protein
MAKKPQKKTRRVKKAPLKITTYHKRKTNAKSIRFTKGQHDPEKVLETIQRFDYSKFDYLRRRNKPNGRNYKPPQGIVVIVTIKKGRNEYHRTRVTDFDYVVNKQSLKAFVEKCVAELLEDFNTRGDSMEDDANEPEGEDIAGDYLDNLDPAFISEVTVKFIYGKTEA